MKKLYTTKYNTTNIYECHRCGMLFKGNRTHNVTYNGEIFDVEKRINGIGFVSVERRNGKKQNNKIGPVYYLCDDCLAKLMDWLRNPNLEEEIY